MLRAAVLLLFLRGLHRFSTSGRPNALDACYVAPWRLPRPDLHRLADDDFSGHTIWLLAIYLVRSGYMGYILFQGHR
jgi:hypothetical protein